MEKFLKIGTIISYLMTVAVCAYGILKYKISIYGVIILIVLLSVILFIDCKNMHRIRKIKKFKN